jgi:glyoxylase-like metal-dependent hydrolase (beta-lactamase superfamily II)
MCPGCFGGVGLKVANQVHLIDGTKGSFVYLVLGSEPVLVDTSLPGKSERIVQAVNALGMQMTDIAHIVLTHHDVDHIGNAHVLASLSGATVWASRLEVPYIHGEHQEKGIRKLIRAMVKVEKPHVDKTYDSGARVGSLEVIPSPGHTSGHVSFVVDDVLLAGDLVTTRRGKLKPSPSFLTTDKNALKESIRNIGRLKFDLICPAHGTPVRRSSLWEELL